MRLQLILDVTYTDGAAEDVLRQLLDNVVMHAVNEGMLTGESDAEIESYTHRIETVLQVSKPLQEFFAVEIRNEDGATLDTALCSWVQAPDDILRGWTGVPDTEEGDEQLEQLEMELRQLIKRYGPDTHLVSLVDTDQEGNR